MIRAAALIAGKDLRLQRRSRTVVILGLVAPLTLAFVLNFVFGGLDDPDAPVTFDMGMADLDAGRTGSARGVRGVAGFADVVEGLARTGLVDITTFDDEASARAAVDRGDVEAAWVIPAGFGDAVASGGKTGIAVIGSVDSPNTASFARSVASRYSIGVGTATLAATVAVDTGVASPQQAAAIAQGAAAAAPIATLVPRPADTKVLDTATSVSAGMALFFVFFTAGLPLVSILQERSDGTLSRLLVAPIPTASITAGKVLASVLVGTLSLVALMVASTALMGADWGPPLPAIGVSAAAVLAACGIMALAGSVARTSEQASNVQGVVAFVLGMLGGVFVPISGTERGLLALAQKLTPHRWFLDGIASLRTDDLAAAGWAVVVLIAMGLVTGALGLWRSRAVLRR